MKFKTIQGRLLVFFGLFLLGAVGAVIILGVINSSRINAFILDSTTNLSKNSAERQLRDTARASAFEIRADLEVALDAARTLADVLSGLKDEKIKLKINRDKVVGILGGVLAANENFLGVYSAWEPAAMDNLDSVFANSQGYDETGRFIPYWYRAEDGSLALEPLVDYENQELDANGIRKGEYYLRPKDTKLEAAIDPYPYEIAGKTVWLTSLVAPIVVNDEFLGITGVDMRLDFIQDLAKQVDQEIYGGQGSLTVVSHFGILAASSDNPDLIGKHIKDVFPQTWQEDLKKIQAGKEWIRVEGDRFLAEVPLPLGRTQTPWSVMIQVPTAAVLAEARAQSALIESRQNSALIRQVAAGGIVSVIALIFLWFMARSLSRPIRTITRGAKKFAEGDVGMTGINRKAIEAINTRADEIGETGRAFRDLIDYYREKVRLSEEISNGNLQLDIRLASDQDALGKALQRMIASLNEILGQVDDAVSQVSMGAGQISDSSQSLSSGATEQAASLEQITSSMAEIGSQTKSNAENATQANQLADSARGAAEKGNSQMSEMITAMNAINDSSREIGKIIKTIDDIAFQTNLLALNAAVEAARAGKHGKGFAVVAQEVRNLAGRSAKAAQETSELIEDSVKKVENGVEIAHLTDDVLTEIEEGAAKVADLIAEIAAASNEQSQGVSQVNQGLGQVEQVTQNNTANAEQTAAAAEELSAQAVHLRKLVSRFKLDKHAEKAGRPEDERRIPEHRAKSLPPGDEQWGGRAGTQAGPNVRIALDDDEFDNF